MALILYVISHLDTYKNDKLTEQNNNYDKKQNTNNYGNSNYFQLDFPYLIFRSCRQQVKSHVYLHYGIN